MRNSSFRLSKVLPDIVIFLKGGAIGIANIIPGVSGGTLAVILGIYDRLVESISCFFERPEKRKEYIFFILKVFIGAAVSLVLLAKLMDRMLTYHLMATMYLFMGLILGGIPVVFRAHDDMRPGLSRVLFFGIGACCVMLLSTCNVDAESAKAAAGGVGAEQSFNVLWTFFAGFVAGGAMIVPGLSGSFILVVLGQYPLMISALKELQLIPLVVLGGGAISGIFIFSRVINICLYKAPAKTYYLILGLIAASFVEIFPGIPSGVSGKLSIAVCFLSGCFISYLLSRIPINPEN